MGRSLDAVSLHLKISGFLTRPAAEATQNLDFIVFFTFFRRYPPFGGRKWFSAENPTRQDIVGLFLADKRPPQRGRFLLKGADGKPEKNMADIWRILIE